MKEIDSISLQHLRAALQVVKDGLAESIQEIDSLESAAADTCKSIYATVSKPGTVDLLASDNENYCNEVIKLITTGISECLNLYFQQAHRRKKGELLPSSSSSLLKDVGDPSLQGSTEVVVKHHEDEGQDEVEGEHIHTSMVMKDLLIRFIKLDQRVQVCLFYAGLFPENEVIKKRTLIYWLIAMYMVISYEEGEEYFRELVGSGLVQPIRERHDDNARACFLTTQVRNFLNSQNDGSWLDFKHHCLRADSKQHVVDVCPNPFDENYFDENYRFPYTILNRSAQFLTCNRLNFSSLVPFLRRNLFVLHLGRWQSPFLDYHKHHIEVDDARFLDSIMCMERLRYLSLQGVSNIMTLPSDSWRQQRQARARKCLASLQILDLRDCTDLESISPEMITLMRNLTHLDVSGCLYLTQMPKGLNNLSQLQVLKGCIVNQQQSSSSSSSTGGVLSELKQLKRLRKLSIKLVGETGLIDMSDMYSLQLLTITWGEKMTHDIKFPLRIEKLDLRRIPDSESPPWLDALQHLHLKKLYIRGGKLKALRISPNSHAYLKVLRLRFLKELEVFESDGFVPKRLPQISFIEVHECPKIKHYFPFLNYDGYWKK